MNAVATVSTSTSPLLSMYFVVVSNSTEAALILVLTELVAADSRLPAASRVPTARFFGFWRDFGIVRSFAGKLRHYIRQSGSIQIRTASSPGIAGQLPPARPAGLASLQG